VDVVARLRDDVNAGPLARTPDWPFVPHVSLTTDATPERIDAGVVALADYQAVVHVDRVHVLQEGDDRVWRPLADASLGPTAVVGRGGLPVELAVTEGLDPRAERFLVTAWEDHEVASHTADGEETRRYAVTAYREGEVVGVAVGTSSETLWLDRLVVAAHTRRQGIGSQLLASVVALAADRGCSRVALVVPAGGPAQALSEARGFVVDIKLPDWRDGHDFVRMVRRLD
jgi:GNAT superfamily N-acetyltransferase